MSVHPIELWKLEKLLRKPQFNHFFVTNSLVRNTWLKEFVKVKVIRHQEVDIWSIELNILLVHDGGAWKDVKVEWSHYILSLLSIPFECGDTPLECVMSLDCVLELLVLVFGCIVIMLLVFKTNAQTPELRVDSQKVSWLDRFPD